MQRNSGIQTHIQRILLWLFWMSQVDFRVHGCWQGLWTFWTELGSKKELGITETGVISLIVIPVRWLSGPEIKQEDKSISSRQTSWANENHNSKLFQNILGRMLAFFWPSSPLHMPVLPVKKEGNYEYQTFWLQQPWNNQMEIQTLRTNTIISCTTRLWALTPFWRSKVIKSLGIKRTF